MAGRWRLLAASRGRFGRISHQNFSADYLAEVREFIQEGSVRGMKLYPGYEPFYPSDPKLEPVYQLAAEFKVPVMIHTSRSPIRPCGRAPCWTDSDSQPGGTGRVTCSVCRVARKAVRHP
jgi:hypothetical protein